MGLGGGVAAFFGLRAGFAPSFIDDRLRDPRGNEPHGQPFAYPQVPRVLAEGARLAVTAGVSIRGNRPATAVENAVWWLRRGRKYTSASAIWARAWTLK